jgi:hypothetical protein
MVSRAAARNHASVCLDRLPAAIAPTTVSWLANHVVAYYLPAHASLAAALNAISTVLMVLQHVEVRQTFALPMVAEDLSAGVVGTAQASLIHHVVSPQVKTGVGLP